MLTYYTIRLKRNWKSQPSPNLGSFFIWVWRIIIYSSIVYFDQVNWKGFWLIKDKPVISIRLQGELLGGRWLKRGGKMKLVYFVLVLGVLNHQSCGRWQPSKTEKLTSGQHVEVDYYYSFRFSFCFNIGRKIWYAQSFSFDFVFCLAPHSN